MVDFVVTVKNEAFLAKLQGFPSKFHARILPVVKRLSIALQREVMVKLTGQVLNVRTGTLRRSINQEVLDSPQGIRGIVGTNVSYAAIHEYGYDGPVNVRAHLRTIKEAFGRPLTKGHKTFEVSAHVRNVHVPERSFLRSTLNEFEPRIKEEISEAAREAIRL